MKLLLKIKLDAKIGQKTKKDKQIIAYDGHYLIKFLL